MTKMTSKSFSRHLLDKYIIRAIRLIGRNFLGGYYDDCTQWSRFANDEKLDSYKHFKKYFCDSSLFEDATALRIWAIKQALASSINPIQHATDELYLEFGVHNGISMNTFSKILSESNKNIYGFDSFHGLCVEWKGTIFREGTLDIGGTPPKVRKNVKLIIGKVQDTLDSFLEEHQKKKVNFIHMDVDTYPPTKFILEKIKPYLNNGCVILFDQLHNYSGWKSNEYKALMEVFDEKEFEFIGFDLGKEIGQAAAIKFIR